MEFIDRERELARLEALAVSTDGGLAVVYGRRRIGKTRLLLEWVRDRGGVYVFSDQSSPDVQRCYVADAVGSRLDGFAEVRYPDWRQLLTRLARDAARCGWRGPLVIDELPYLVASSPELPSVLQGWVDGVARQARLVIALAGSSQRMMQGLVLDRTAPLFGRAREILALQPLAPRYLRPALGMRRVTELVQAYAAWGGIPRYWELAAVTRGTTVEQLEHLVLDPLGPLHREPEQLLLEELPPAIEVRPVLDAIGSGAHRLSEIGSRVGRPATGLSRPLERLVELGLVRRESPFGEPACGGKRSLYRIDDPFTRFWFRVVAPSRALLAAGPPGVGPALLGKHWSHLCGQAWEDLCRRCLHRQPPDSTLGRLGPWGPGARWWWRNHPEWDAVSASLDGSRLLLVEARWSERPVRVTALGRMAREVAWRPAPTLSGTTPREQIRALFVPEVTRRPQGPIDGVLVVTGAEVLAAASE